MNMLHLQNLRLGCSDRMCSLQNKDRKEHSKAEKNNNNFKMNKLEENFDINHSTCLSGRNSNVKTLHAHKQVVQIRIFLINACLTSI